MKIYIQNKEFFVVKVIDLITTDRSNNAKRKLSSKNPWVLSHKGDEKVGYKF